MGAEHISDLVSVVIPTFNRAEKLCSAISSVLVQTYDHIEIIVVDDGSTDDTRARVAALADTRIRYLGRQVNRGVSISRNEGVQASCGVFVAFLDSDDRWEPTKVELLVSHIKQYPDPENVVSYSQVNAFDGRIAAISPRRSRAPEESLGEYLLSWDGAICPSTLMLSRRLALRVPFNTAYRTMEDWDLFLRLDALGVQWCYIERPLTVFDWSRK